MQGARQFILVAVVAALAGLGGFLVRQQGTATHELAADRIAPGAVDSLFALSLPDLDGQLQPLAQWRGSIVVFNFWATWCPPCREEIPAFVAVSEAYRGRGVHFVGLSIDSAAEVAAFAREFAVSYPLLIGDERTVALGKAFGNQAGALPFTVIIDAEGKPRLLQLGGLKQDRLERTIRTLLASAG